MTRYKRNAKGTVIHRVDCKRAGATSMPWTYADNMTPEMIAEQIVRYGWLRGCGHCRPEVAR